MTKDIVAQLGEMQDELAELKKFKNICSMEVCDLLGMIECEEPAIRICDSEGSCVYDKPSKCWPDMPGLGKYYTAEVIWISTVTPELVELRISPDSERLLIL